eukprot:2273054-Amphidinium_carterae.1
MVAEQTCERRTSTSPADLHDEAVREENKTRMTTTHDWLQDLPVWPRVSVVAADSMVDQFMFKK